jgi:hypothetical protein
MNLLRRRMRTDRRDAGFALITVMLVAIVITALTSAVVFEAVNTLPQNRHEVGYQAALGAAESGVDDFIDRLDQDYNYATDPDSNTALTQFTPVAPGSANSYTYTVDSSQLNSQGIVYLNVTGKSGTVTRTIRVGLRPVGFLDALSTTDYNLVDPLLDYAPGWNYQQTVNNCVYYAYQARPATPESGAGTGPAGNCYGLLNYWITGNVLNGPMHSNDDFYLCGTPEFDGPVTSGDPGNPVTSKFWLDPYGGCGGDSPAFQSGGRVTGGEKVTFPPSDSSIAQWAAVGSSTGCLYTGPTAITLSGTTMTVVSPDTISTNPNCVGTNVPLPADGVIYDQSIPGSGDPNYSATCAVDTSSWSGDDCHLGDVFIQGTLAGQLTVAAANNVIITGDLTYDSFTATAPRRVLGLIAQNTIEINHPVSNGNNVTGTVAFNSSVKFNVPIANPTVDAALLSLDHSFAVMNFDQGSPNGLGSVNLNGAVAGKFMDIEGVFSGNGSLVNGYGVNYDYDSRFLNGALVPPHFLDPSKSYWKRFSYTECASPTTCTSS